MVTINRRSREHSPQCRVKGEQRRILRPGCGDGADKADDGETNEIYIYIIENNI